ncbi:hypothetical protein KKC60_03220 [Patescibacteria group bacterium]|nr:hypothetical protein [Patescibacteria group bacterium]
MENKHKNDLEFAKQAIEEHPILAPEFKKALERVLKERDKEVTSLEEEVKEIKSSIESNNKGSRKTGLNGFLSQG